MTPKNQMLGRAEAIFAERKAKLAAAAAKRVLAQQEHDRAAAA